MSGTLSGPVFSGITPGGSLGQQLQAITRRAVIPSVYVQIYQAHPLLSLFLSNAQRARGGVSQVTIPAQGASFVSFNWGSFAGDFPMPEDQAAIQDAQFNLKLGMVPIGFFGMEAIVQSSEVIIPKLRAVTSDAATVIKQAIAQALYTNNAANALAIDSLAQAFDNGTNTTSYGGIARTNAFWQGQYYPNMGGQATISSRSGMATILVRTMTGAGGEAPDFVVMNPADWTTLMQDFLGLEQFQTTPRSIYAKGDVVNAGFRAIRVLDREARVSLQSERRHFAPYGLHGGSAGKPGRNAVIRADLTVAEAAGKASLSLGPDDIIVVETPGGGGWGPA